MSRNRARGSLGSPTPEAPILNILIIRTSAMGDIVHCLPVLRALRHGLPGARIGWVVERTFAPMLEGHPDIDELIVVQLREWRKNLLSRETRGEIVAARRAMRTFGADLALDLMGNHKGGIVAFASGAKRTLGASRPFRREASSALWLGETIDAPGVHAVDRALALLAGLDLPPSTVDFGGDRVLRERPPEAEAFLARRTRPFVTIQAGAGWGNKTYPSAWWGEVARRIRDRTGLGVWVPIAPGEEHLAAAVVEASDGAARAVEAYAFGFLAALLRASRLVLGGDTGPIHLAHALGTPVLCLIGPTDPTRNGPYDAADQVLWQRLPCSCCYKRFSEAKACLLNLSPDQVVARALEALPESG